MTCDSPFQATPQSTTKSRYCLSNAGHKIGERQPERAHHRGRLLETVQSKSVLDFEETDQISIGSARRLPQTDQQAERKLFVPKLAYYIVKLANLY